MTCELQMCVNSSKFYLFFCSFLTFFYIKVQTEILWGLCWTGRPFLALHYSSLSRLQPSYGLIQRWDLGEAWIWTQEAVVADLRMELLDGRCALGVSHPPPEDVETQWKITALLLSIHLPTMERAHCVPLGLILSHQPPQKPSDPITGIRPGPRPWKGEPRNRPESTAHSLKITHTHMKIWWQEEI